VSTFGRTPLSICSRIAPALAPLVLAPIIAEFLLGDFSGRQLGFIAAFVPQYGGGALLVREMARRTGRGWPTMVLLALTYALIEEGFIGRFVAGETALGVPTTVWDLAGQVLLVGCVLGAIRAGAVRLRHTPA
jgi:hypothetical protein